MVEVLSICPTNWGLTTAEANNWLEENMVPFYPLGVLKRPDADETPAPVAAEVLEGA